jgi:hypothetical protein
LKRKLSSKKYSITYNKCANSVHTVIINDIKLKRVCYVVLEVIYPYPYHYKVSYMPLDKEKKIYKCTTNTLQDAITEVTIIL